MTEFRSIEIDFDIHKLIEGERANFRESANDALRRLLKLPPKTAIKPASKANGHRPWSDEGVTLAHGTAIRMLYNRRLYEGGEIVDGKWVIGGKTFDSPSGAASGIAVTKKGKHTRLDGWNYWQAKQPGEGDWTLISSLRKKAERA